MHKSENHFKLNEIETMLLVFLSLVVALVLMLTTIDILLDAIKYNDELRMTLSIIGTIVYLFYSLLGIGYFIWLIKNKSISQ